MNAALPPVPGSQQVTNSLVTRDLFQIQGVTGNVMVNGGPVVHSAYPEQVRQIAPQQLCGRDSELTELAAFCIEPSRGPYAWWQARAWAGKSALMSWFVLHPPPGVRIVSFFITSRYAGQNDRVAFTDVVLEQLAEVLARRRACPSAHWASSRRLMSGAVDVPDMLVIPFMGRTSPRGRISRTPAPAT
jgi:hypothetical protein